MEFKRGIISKAEYYMEQIGLMDIVFQDLEIEYYDEEEEDINTFNVTWKIKDNEDLYGMGDHVSFLEEDGNIIHMRLNNQQ